MVVQGKFTLELIDAVTKTPFMEHRGKDGNTYAEVEPEIEYFIRIASKDPRTVSVSLHVDGKNLGYTQMVPPHSNLTRGLWNVRDGISSFTALKFNKLVNIRDSASSSSCQDQNEHIHWTGCVEMKVYEVTGSRTSIDSKNVESKWASNTDHVLKGLKVSSKKKALNSKEGSITTGEQKLKTSTLAELGSKLASVKLLYCSTVGLIAAKVLAPPPPADMSEINPTIDDSDDEVIISKKRRLDLRDMLENL